MVLDPQSFEEWFAEEHGTNPLDFPGYVDKLTAVREKTGLKEAVTVGKVRFMEKMQSLVCAMPDL